MPTTPILAIEHIVQSQFQKEVTANLAFDNLERAIAQTASVDVNGPAGIFILEDELMKDAVIGFVGLLTGARTVQVPARSKFYLVIDNTTGGEVVTVGTSGGIKVALRNGEFVHLYCDGVDTFEVSRLLLDQTTDITAATYTPVEGDRVVMGNTTSNVVAITLPTPVVIGRRIHIIRA